MTVDIDSEIKALQQWIAKAESAAGRGEPVDLDGLDGRIASLCESVAALPGDEAEGLRPHLGAILADIERLRSALQSQFETVRSQVQDHSRRSEAARAYSQWTAKRGPKA